eukprot:9496003-Pyramimonas_sp.AAC.1
MVMVFFTLFGAATGRKSTGALAQSVQTPELFSRDAFPSLLLLLHVLVHENVPSRAQCEIAALALHEEALRVPGGSQS